MFAAASCEDGKTSVYFASARFESASPLPRIPISITGHHPLPIRPPIDALQFHVRVSKITNLSNSLPYSRSLFRNEARRPGSKEIRPSLEERETSFAQRHSNTSNHTEKLYYTEIIRRFLRIRSFSNWR